MIYQSALLYERDPRPYVMLFEIVEGAKLVGHTDPGAVVRVELEIKPRTGRNFTYSGRVVANPNGEYAIRVPYPNEPFSPEIEPGDHYTLRVGKLLAVVVVSELDVLNGSEIEVPAFER